MGFRDVVRELLDLDDNAIAVTDGSSIFVSSSSESADIADLIDYLSHVHGGDDVVLVNANRGSYQIKTVSGCETNSGVVDRDTIASVVDVEGTLLVSGTPHGIEVNGINFEQKDLAELIKEGEVLDGRQVIKKVGNDQYLSCRFGSAKPQIPDDKVYREGILVSKREEVVEVKPVRKKVVTPVIEEDEQEDDEPDAEQQILRGRSYKSTEEVLTEKQKVAKEAEIILEKMRLKSLAPGGTPQKTIITEDAIKELFIPAFFPYAFTSSEVLNVYVPMGWGDALVECMYDGEALRPRRKEVLRAFYEGQHVRPEGVLNVRRLDNDVYDVFVDRSGSFQQLRNDVKGMKPVYNATALQRHIAQRSVHSFSRRDLEEGIVPVHDLRVDYFPKVGIPFFIDTRLGRHVVQIEPVENSFGEDEYAIVPLKDVPKELQNLAPIARADSLKQFFAAKHRVTDIEFDKKEKKVYYSLREEDITPGKHVLHLRMKEVTPIAIYKGLIEESVF